MMAVRKFIGAEAIAPLAGSPSVRGGEWRKGAVEGIARLWRLSCALWR